MKAPSRPSLSRRARVLTGVGAALVSTIGVVAGSTGPAGADTTRCVGAVQTPGAFACYTSPRWDNAGLERESVATFPTICYGLGCTATDFHVFAPGDEVDGRYTSVFYLGHSYTVYRPAATQPFVLTSDNPRLDDATTLQVLALSAALDAANGL
jgi:hypothetical protein